MLQAGGVAVVVLVGALCMRAASLEADAQRPERFPLPEVDANAVAQHMSALVRHPTLTVLDSQGNATPGADRAAFERLRRTLAELYPRAHEVMSLELVDDSLLYTWPGTEPDAPPVLFTAHTDVVPVEPGTEADWSYPPFSGEVTADHVWGRGSIDDKLGVVGVMEAVEHLATDGFVPRRSVLVAFGHDEETGGSRGATLISDTLRERGVRPWFVFDEGGAVIKNMLPGIDKPIALVGVAEKGYVSLELVAKGEGGHSNMPPPRSAIGRLSTAIDKLEADPFPAEIRGATGLMIDAIAPHTPFTWRIALANRWLFDKGIAVALGSQQASNAAVRTTTAVTRFDAGIADNVLASRARAVVNFRLLPGDTPESVVAHVRDAIDDESIEVRCAGECRAASVESRTDGPAFELIRRTMASVFPQAVLAPYLVIGGTDSRHYQPLAEEGAFRFLPVRLSPEDRARMHGTDERISIRDLEAATQFYTLLMREAAR